MLVRDRFDEARCGAHRDHGKRRGLRFASRLQTIVLCSFCEGTSTLLGAWIVVTRTGRRCVALAFVSLLTSAGSSAGGAGREIAYRLVCGASAGIALDHEHFVVADDEHDILDVFKVNRRFPVRSIDLRSFLGNEDGQTSALEGAARIGDRIYWISSHGRSSHGEVEPSRYRFFATDIAADAPYEPRPVAQPYLRLLTDLMYEPMLARYKLAAAADLGAEEPGGLAIEGLAARQDGSLLIGFRNPVRTGKALLVPLLNPADLLLGGPADFGPPIDLDLQGRGIRSIERVGDTFWIVAGPTGDKKGWGRDAFALYRWSGQERESAQRVTGIDFGNLSPEGLFAWPNGRLEFPSDDSEREILFKRCKSLDKSEREFRTIVIVP